MLIDLVGAWVCGWIQGWQDLLGGFSAYGVEALSFFEKVHGVSQGTVKAKPPMKTPRILHTMFAGGKAPLERSRVSSTIIRLFSRSSFYRRVSLAYDLHEPPMANTGAETVKKGPIVFMHGLFGSKRNNRSMSKYVTITHCFVVSCSLQNVIES